jgi:hypothetical protein
MEFVSVMSVDFYHQNLFGTVWIPTKFRWKINKNDRKQKINPLKIWWFGEKVVTLQPFNQNEHKKDNIE